MFDLVKQKVNLIEVLEKDLSVSFKQMGEKNWIIDGGKEIEACPFCGHHDCFRVSYQDGDNASAFYKCFSCGEYGDVVTWISKERKISLGEAVRKLAEEYDIKLPTNYDPVQEVFSLAANFYHTCLVDTCNKPYPVLEGLTPLRYQEEIRGHKLETLVKYKIGFSNGELIEYLDSLGIDSEVIKKSGLVNNKNGKDFLPANCFIYPHFVNGKVSHFTFKDPLKKIQYQLPKKYSLNGHLFYGQDTAKSANSIALVEGENDWLSIVEAGGINTLAIIGQISGEQLNWLRENCKDKQLVTIFDPDEAGDSYREKVQALSTSFKGLIHIKPPEGKDIDEHLRNGEDLSMIIKNHRVIVTPYSNSNKKSPAANTWDSLFSNGEDKNAPQFPMQVGEGLTVVGPKSESNEVLEKSEEESSYNEVVQIDDTSVIMTKNCYHKVVYKEGLPSYIRLSDFTLELKNIILDEEDGDRRREVVIRRQDGFRSDIFEVDSATKVNSAKFKELMAKKADAEWTGKDLDLDGLWRLVYSQYPEVIVRVVHQVGRLDKYKCWVFKNLMITDSGSIIKPDEDGVFWISGKSNGIKLKDIAEENSGPGGIPALYTDLSKEEADRLLFEIIRSLSKNFNQLGPALMAVGWIYANLYSNYIYRVDGGFGPLMLWGVHGGGKSTIARWLQSFFGFTEKMGSTSVPRLVSPVGFMRQGAYYASLPLLLDEVRADEQTNEHLGMIRAWYDRESRVMAQKTGNNVKRVPIKSTLLMAGEDLPSDPATKERCIMLRIPYTDPNSEIMRANYKFMTDNCHKFSGITYHWLVNAVNENPSNILMRIRELDGLLVKHGCSSRISKVWSSAGFFAKKLSEQFFPDFNFQEFIVDMSVQEQIFQKTDNTLFRFFDSIEVLKGRENSPITENQIMMEGDKVHLWFSAIFSELNNQSRSKEDKWSKFALLRAIREQPYFISDSKKIHMGLSGIKRTVITLDLKTCPESLRNVVGYVLPEEYEDEKQRLLEESRILTEKLKIN